MKKAIVLVVALMISTISAAEEPFPEEWLTVAEKSDFRATSSFDETIAFLNKVEAAAPDTIRVDTFGFSGRGFLLPLVIVSCEGAFTPPADRKIGQTDSAHSELHPRRRGRRQRRDT